MYFAVLVSGLFGGFKIEDKFVNSRSQNRGFTISAKRTKINYLNGFMQIFPQQKSSNISKSQGKHHRLWRFEEEEKQSML